MGTMIPLGARVIIPGQCENITLSQEKRRGGEEEKEEEGKKWSNIRNRLLENENTPKADGGPRTLIE